MTICVQENNNIGLLWKPFGRTLKSLSRAFIPIIVWRRSYENFCQSQPLLSESSCWTFSRSWRQYLLFKNDNFFIRIRTNKAASASADHIIILYQMSFFSKNFLTKFPQNWLCWPFPSFFWTIPIHLPCGKHQYCQKLLNQNFQHRSIIARNFQH